MAIKTSNYGGEITKKITDFFGKDSQKRVGEVDLTYRGHLNMADRNGEVNLSDVYFIFTCRKKGKEFSASELEIEQAGAELLEKMFGNVVGEVYSFPNDFNGADKAVIDKLTRILNGESIFQ